MASGVLPVAIGKASKLIDYMPEDKAYSVSMVFGKVSDTFDLEGHIEEFSNKKVTLEEIENALLNFRGKIEQIPPAFSAVHYNGKRLYELAREGKIPDDIPKRVITVYKNEIISFDYEQQILKLEIECSKGTYIRSIVNDLGQLLGTGAVMTELIRTKSSGLDINSSLALDESLNKEVIKQSLINPISILNMPVVEVSEVDFEKIKNGNRYRKTINVEGDILLVKNDKILAIAVSDSNYIQPKKVLLWGVFLYYCF